jgi:three-Cys-motif partner protein
MSKPIKSDEFFEERSEQSEIKALIVSKYFKPWAKIILSALEKYNGKRSIAYIDLFAGPGKYKDGSFSTPLLVVEEALKDEAIRASLHCLFNDANKNNITALQENIKSVSGIELLKHVPDFENESIDTGKLFEDMKSLIPTLLFADPWGYSGLSLELLGSVLQHWGCECIFFFNYNRINAGLNNPSVKERMDAIFGERRAEELRKILTPLNPQEREKKIIEEMENALKGAGAKFVLAFPFRKSKGTSHHLIFATKNRRGYDIMKEIMAKRGREIASGVSALEYSPEKQISMLFEDPLDKLGKELIHEFSGQTIRLIEVFNKHSLGKNYRLTNYKNALLRLESKSLIQVQPPANERRPNTFGDNVLITFP